MSSGARLPPGQIETKRFPVVGERRPSRELTDPGSWVLTIAGEVTPAFSLTLTEFLERANQPLTFDVHCVTSWTRFHSAFTGVPLADIVAGTHIDEGARFVSFAAYSQRDHHVSLPLDTALESSWLVHSFEGEPLAVEHGGPVRVVTPGRYFYKSLKWVKTITFLEEDRLGWWEKNSSYHNNADPWPGDQRFTTGSLRPEQLQRFLEAPNYDKYRGKVFLGLDLRSWSPESRDLSRLYLKSCDLRGVVLSNRDLRNSNLSLSDLTGADLSGSDLSGSDLEGARFTRANLVGANLSDTLLSATRFEGASVDGLSLEGGQGLLEDQMSYLASMGVALPLPPGPL